MATARRKLLLHVILSVCGLACVGFALYQLQYLRMTAQGNDAVVAQRFDTQHYEQAGHYWFANEALLLFNQGVLAFKARNLPRAVEYFRQVDQRTDDLSLRVQSQYNLGLVMLELNETERAAEFFKETLRLLPQDLDAKFNLERLYHFVMQRQGAQGEASMPQAPGTSQEKEKGRGTDGQGRSKSPSGI